MWGFITVSVGFLETVKVVVESVFYYWGFFVGYFIYVEYYFYFWVIVINEIGEVFVSFELMFLRLVI